MRSGVRPHGTDRRCLGRRISQAVLHTALERAGRARRRPCSTLSARRPQFDTHHSPITGTLGEYTRDHRIDSSNGVFGSAWSAVGAALSSERCTPNRGAATNAGSSVAGALSSDLRARVSGEDLLLR